MQHCCLMVLSRREPDEKAHHRSLFASCLVPWYKEYLSSKLSLLSEFICLCFPVCNFRLICHQFCLFKAVLAMVAAKQRSFKNEMLSSESSWKVVMFSFKFFLIGLSFYSCNYTTVQRLYSRLTSSSSNNNNNKSLQHVRKIVPVETFSVFYFLEQSSIKFTVVFWFLTYWCVKKW